MEDATPLKDEQFIQLLESIPNPSWRLAIGLVGCFGLRPSELRHLRVEGSKLRVAPVKRNRSGSSKARLVRGLDPVGHEGLSEALLEELKSGSTPLPGLGSDNKTAGDNLRQYLDRNLTWVALRQKSADRAERLTPYGLRHGYALRAHLRYHLQPRIAAALMGHSPNTHNKHYGRWTDEATVDEAVDQAINRIQAANRPRSRIRLTQPELRSLQVVLMTRQASAS
ncbi:MAG: hypothetical protein WBN89_01510 [Prochlorococcaceae cyanobacterium]